MQPADARKSAILKLTQGVAFLRSPGLPSVAADLSLFGEESCSCSLPLSHLDAGTAQNWTEHLQVGRKIFADLAAPPHLPGVHLEIEVQSTERYANGHIELGLGFLEVQEEEREILKHALDSLEGKPNGLPTKRLSAFATGLAGVDAQQPTPPRGIDVRGLLSASPNPRTNPPQPAQSDPFRGRRLGEILKQLGKLTAAQVEEAHRGSKAACERLGRYLMRNGLVTPLELCSALSLQSGLPMVDLTDRNELPADLLVTFSYLHMLRHEYVPYEQTETELRVAALCPLGEDVLEEIARRCGKHVAVALAEDDAILRLLHGLQPKKDRKLRKHARHRVSVPIEFRFFNQQLGVLGDDRFVGRTVDVSEGGLRLALAEDIRGRGTCVQFSFAVAPHHVEGLCSLRYVKDHHGPGQDEAPWLVGLQLMDATQESRAAIKEICNRLAMWKRQDRYKSFEDEEASS